MDGLPRPIQNRIENYHKALHVFEKQLSEKSIHKLRVSIRKLRVGLEVFQEIKPKNSFLNLEKYIKKQFKTLGTVRDIQVIESIVGKNNIYQEFKKYLVKKEKKELKKLKHFQWEWPKKTKKMEPEILLKNDLPSSHLWKNTLIKRTHLAHQEFIKNLNKATVSDIETVHNLRISLKRYRYLLELGQKEFPHFEMELKEIKKMQLYLGEVQDLEVLEKFLKKYLDKKKASPLIQKKFLALQKLKHKKASKALWYFYKNPRLPSPPDFS